MSLHKKLCFTLKSTVSSNIPPKKKDVEPEPEALLLELGADDDKEYQKDFQEYDGKEESSSEASSSSEKRPRAKVDKVDKKCPQFKIYQRDDQIDMSVQNVYESIIVGTVLNPLTPISETIKGSIFHIILDSTLYHRYPIRFTVELARNPAIFTINCAHVSQVSPISKSKYCLKVRSEDDGTLTVTEKKLLNKNKKSKVDDDDQDDEVGDEVEEVVEAVSSDQIVPLAQDTDNDIFDDFFSQAKAAFVKDPKIIAEARAQVLNDPNIKAELAAMAKLEALEELKQKMTVQLKRKLEKK